MEKEYVAAKIFIEAVLPNLIKILDYYPTIAEKFSNRSFVLQMRVADSDFPLAINFAVINGVWTCNVGQLSEKSDIEFVFASASNFNSFMLGLSSPYPKIKGLLKIALLKDVFALISKFAFIMQANSPCVDLIDRDCQTRIMLDILPKAIGVLCAENLSELVINFSSVANVVLKIEVAGANYNAQDIVLKYAPQNSSIMPKAQVCTFYFTDRQQVAQALLSGEFTEDLLQANSSFSLEIMKFFINSVNYYARLKYRN